VSVPSAFTLCVRRTCSERAPGAERFRFIAGPVASLGSSARGKLGFRNALRDEIVHAERKVEKHALLVLGEPKASHPTDLVETIGDLLMCAQFLRRGLAPSRMLIKSPATPTSSKSMTVAFRFWRATSNAMWASFHAAGMSIGSQQGRLKPTCTIEWGTRRMISDMRS
jgi:hypothetical protein